MLGQLYIFLFLLMECYKQLFRQMADVNLNFSLESVIFHNDNNYYYGSWWQNSSKLYRNHRLFTNLETRHKLIKMTWGKFYVLNFGDVDFNIGKNYFNSNYGTSSQ